VATCLHAEFAAVTPAIRLLWIERFSQFDRPAQLRDLTVLPQYGRLERDDRRRLQEFADWLFARVKKSEGDALTLVNDLVRLCLLLASHAPVNRIIAGHIPRPTPVRPGIHIPIRPVTPDLVRVGMEVQVWKATQLVARGRVDDLHEGGCTIVMVLHDLNLAVRYSDNLIVMKSGSIVAQGHPSEVVTSELLLDTFGLAAKVIDDPVSERPLIVPIGRTHVVSKSDQALG